MGEMMGEDIEPLDAALWFRRIEMIANRELGCVENSLRHASHLIFLAPAPFRRHLQLAIDEQRFEALLDSGEFDAAARYLVAEPPSLSVGNPDDASAIKATIRCPILNRAIDGHGTTVANAMLDAWATGMLELRRALDANCSRSLDQQRPRLLG
jgi:hypothetical protein